MESLNRLVAVLWAPTETFRKISERPTWAAALIVLLLIGGGVTWLGYQHVDVDAQRTLVRDQIERRSGLRGEELDQQVDRMMEFNSKIVPFIPVIGVVFSIGFYALVAVLFLVALRLAGGEIGYVQSFATTLHALVPLAVAALVTIPVILSQGTIDPERLQSGTLLASNLSFLAPDDAPKALVALLSSFDLFTVWAVILCTIGYSVVAKVSKGVAAAVVVGLWAVGIAVKVGFVALFT